MEESRTILKAHVKVDHFGGGACFDSMDDGVEKESIRTLALYELTHQNTGLLELSSEA